MTPLDSPKRQRERNKIADREAALMAKAARLDEVIPCRSTGIPRCLRLLEEGGIDHAFIGRHGRPVAVLIDIDRYQQLVRAASS